jgi:phosphoglycerate dehydrogenase-like enzyme
MIVFSPMLEPDALAIGQQLIPNGFEFEVVTADAVPSAIADADYLMGFIGTISTEALMAAKRLRLVQLMSVGYDKFNLDGARQRRLPVSVNGGANAISVAEHAIMLMLNTLRHVTELDANVRAGVWGGGPASRFRLYEIWSSTIGIVGMGRIGQQVAQRLQGWSANLVYYDPYRLAPERERELNVTYMDLDDLLKAADAVTVHVPYSADTHHLIDDRRLRLMKRSAVIVNTSRGVLIDEQALVKALREGVIGGAGLDVFEQEPCPPGHPIYDIPNTCLTPHLAGPTWQSWPRRFENCFANIARVQRGEKPLWVVPELADIV